jgi:phage tail sheath protein FI
MPITPTYPGVYIEEVPSGVRTITGVATSITAFIGRAKKGKLNDPVLLQSFADYVRKFGGPWEDSTLSYTVRHYFLHGGRDALIVRVINNGTKASVNVPTATDNLVLEAANEGDWGEALQVAVDYDTKDTATLFNLTIQELKEPGSTEIITEEKFRNLSMTSTNVRFITTILEQQSELVRVKTITTERPSETSGYIAAASDGDDGTDISDLQLTDSSLEDNREGIYALEKADLFNILCIPPLSRSTDVDINTTLVNAVQYCKKRRAMLIIDPLSTWTSVDKAKDGVKSLRTSLGNDYSTNAAVYFPRLKMADSLKDGLTEEFTPCGVIAGIYARTDAQRGVWKAPAGQEASLSGVKEFTYKLTDAQNGTLNPLGLNCLRSFPVSGNIVWGARTLAGADQLASEWKYIPVRRLALYIEESLYRGTQWVVFEPNDEPLWAQIRLNIGAFMHDLFIDGAFQGTSPREAYFVKCDKETTTQNDIDKGIVNILVGFAPLKPAEFVIIKIQQIAGEIQT